jgi:hypothetical protein
MYLSAARTSISRAVSFGGAGFWGGVGRELERCYDPSMNDVPERITIDDFTEIMRKITGVYNSMHVIAQHGNTLVTGRRSFCACSTR